MLIICRIFVLCFIIELISSQSGPSPINHGPKDVSIQTYPDEEIDPRPIVLELKHEVTKLKEALDSLVNKINAIPPSSIATKYIHNGLLSSICILLIVYYHLQKS
uniref:Tegumental protein Sh13 n=1 Tax=Schistosoma haematobium TaxID=6185 RepID=Q0R5S0_SCHHA|nr:tegumental protein Sh13 [Schistosoma haematobium]